MSSLNEIRFAAEYWYGDVSIDSCCLAEVRLLNGEKLNPYGTWEELDESFEERAFILESEASYSRHEAEEQAAQQLGFKNKAGLKNLVQALKARLVSS
jgi:hypothetical protein